MEYNESTIRARLTSLGYTFPEASSGSDNALVNFAMTRVADYIKNDTNQSEIPTGLVTLAIELACARFFNDKMAFAPDDLTGLDLSRVANQITEGDTSVSFKDGYSDAELLTAFYTRAKADLDGQLACFRKLRW